jgi:hypothetical protein
MVIYIFFFSLQKLHLRHLQFACFVQLLSFKGIISLIFSQFSELEQELEGDFSFFFFLCFFFFFFFFFLSHFRELELELELDFLWSLDFL